MKPKRHYIPIVPDKPRQGPKIKREFALKKHEVEKPQVETPPEKPAQSVVWKVVKYVAIAYGVIAVFVFIGAFITILPTLVTTPTHDDATPDYWHSVVDKINQNTNNDGNTYTQKQSTTTNQNTRTTTTSSGKSGYCSTDADCAGFGARNGGPAICGSDRLCHICYSLRGTTCVGCSTGCDVNTYCEKGVCAFKIGGKTTD